MTSKRNNLYTQQHSGWQADFSMADMAVAMSFVACDTLHNPKHIASCLSNDYLTNSALLTIDLAGMETDGAEYGDDLFGMRGGIGHKLPTNQMPTFASQWGSEIELWRKVHPSPILH